MTTPAAPTVNPAPPTPAVPAAPAAPAPAAPAAPAAPPAPAPAPTAEDVARVQAALADERKQRKAAEDELARVRQSTMSDTEKALEAARAEGRAEAERAASLLLVAAEFRLAAAGKLANVEAALSALDLSKLAGKDGKPDAKAIADLVAGLVAVAPPPPPAGHVPAGARTPAPEVNGDGDWLRAVSRPGRRRSIG